MNGAKSFLSHKLPLCCDSATSSSCRAQLSGSSHLTGLKARGGRLQLPESTLPCLGKPGSQPRGEPTPPLRSGLRASVLFGGTGVLSAWGINAQCAECFYLEKQNKNKMVSLSFEPNIQSGLPTLRQCPHGPSKTDGFSGQKDKIHHSKRLLSPGLIHLHSRKDPWLVGQM